MIPCVKPQVNQQEQLNMSLVCNKQVQNSQRVDDQSMKSARYLESNLIDHVGGFNLQNIGCMGRNTVSVKYSLFLYFCYT